MLRIGHRGAAGHAPENTLAALEKGIGLGVDLVEFDVQRTNDGALVLFHDRKLGQLIPGRGSIADSTLRELERLDVGQGQRIPILSDALSLINGRVGAMIEIKLEGIAAQVCKEVEAADFRSPIVYASFWHRELLDIRRLQPSSETLALMEGMPVNPAAFAVEAGATHAGLALDCITKEYVRSLQSRKIKVFVYTVDDPHDIKWVGSIGVDGIISNFPERI